MPEKPRTLTLPADPGPLPDSVEVSELIRDFAQPLLALDPDGPDAIDTMRTSLMLAMICWNLPVYEASGSPLYEQGKRTLAAIKRSVPTAVAAKLSELSRARVTKFAAWTYLVEVELTGTTQQNARIVAQARRSS